MEITRSSNTNSDSILNDFVDPKYRHTFVESNIRNGLAFQLRAMRLAKKLSQEQLAAEFGNPKLQPVISRYENPDYGKYSLTTLQALARLFDVALVVRFEPFSKLIKTMKQSAKVPLAVPSFVQENREGIISAILEHEPLRANTSKLVEQKFYRPTFLLPKKLEAVTEHTDPQYYEQYPQQEATYATQ